MLAIMMLDDARLSFNTKTKGIVIRLGFKKSYRRKLQLGTITNILTILIELILNENFNNFVLLRNSRYQIKVLLRLLSLWQIKPVLEKNRAFENKLIEPTVELYYENVKFSFFLRVRWIKEHGSLRYIYIFHPFSIIFSTVYLHRNK